MIPGAVHHWVYVHIDQAGRALYVGATGALIERQQTHRLHAPWRADVDEIAAVGPMDRETSREFERELIRDLDPLHNKYGRGSWSRKRSAGPAFDRFRIRDTVA